MPEYTSKLNLYKPNRVDSEITVDTSLSANFQKIDDGFGEVTQQLAQVEIEKANTTDVVAQLNDIGVSQINKNKGKIDMTYLSDDLLAQIAGETPVLSVVAPGSVTIDKLAITKKGTNLFNKDTATDGFYVSQYDGQLIADTLFSTSDYILVTPLTSYIKDGSFAYAFYDEHFNFVNGGLGATFIVPEDARYVRISSRDKLTQRLNDGTTLFPYEPYVQPIIKKQYTEKHDITVDDVPKLPLQKVDAFTFKSNLFDKNNVTLNHYLDVATGNLVATNNFVASDFTEIDNVNHIIKHARQVVFYDNQHSFIGGFEATSPYNNVILNPPSNARFVRFSWYILQESIDTQQLNVGTTLLPYEPFGYALKEELLPRQSTSNIKLNLPPKIYGVTGHELNVYFNNILNAPLNDLMIDVTCSIGKHMADKWTVMPTTAGTYNFTITAYKDYEQIAIASTTIVITPANAASVTKKALVIGDSTVNAGQMTQRLLELTDDDVLSVELLGTRGTGVNKHEGRGGWTASRYRQNIDYEVGQPNPFYNASVDDFDFEYYMQQQGYSGLTHAFICLGINDTFAFTSDSAIKDAIATILDNFDALINSIKAYNGNIKIGIFVTIPPNVSQDAFGDAYGNEQTQWRYKRNNAIWIDTLITKYGNRESENIYLVPDNSNVNPTLFRDAVHPSLDGDNQRGDTLFYYLKNV